LRVHPRFSFSDERNVACGHTHESKAQRSHSFGKLLASGEPPERVSQLGAFSADFRTRSRYSFKNNHPDTEQASHCPRYVLAIMA
jgi:hypothetical protein